MQDAANYDASLEYIGCRPNEIATEIRKLPQGKLDRGQQLGSISSFFFPREREREADRQMEGEMDRDRERKRGKKSLLPSVIIPLLSDLLYSQTTDERRKQPIKFLFTGELQSNLGAKRDERLVQRSKRE